MNKKFQVIVADFPYLFSDTLSMSKVPRGAAANYSLMSNKDIINLDLKSLADPDGCLLAVWVPSSLLQVGLDAMRAAGFEQKQTYVWVKTKISPLEKLSDFISSIKELPTKEDFKSLKFSISKFINEFPLSNILAFYMGRLFRQTHEICLIGTNNNKIYKKLENKSQRSVSFAPNLKHSAKPEFLQDSLDIMFPGKDIAKIELFARRQRPRWLCAGNESPMTKGESIEVSLSKLKNISLTQYEELMLVMNDEQKLFEIWGKINY